MKRSGSIRHPGARVVWDEENLGFWESNKTPKQKINEPKTPYHPPDSETNIVTPTPAEHAAHADAIRLALTQVASSSEGRGDSADSADDDGSSCSASTSRAQVRHTSYEAESKSTAMDIDGLPNQLKRRKSFEEKRHIHELEYRRAKGTLSRQPMIEDDESDSRDTKGPSASCGSTSSQDDHESNISKGLGDIDIQDA